MRTLRTATPAAALLIGIALSWPVAAARRPGPDETTAPAPSTGHPAVTSRRRHGPDRQAGQRPLRFAGPVAHGLELLLGQNSTPAAPEPIPRSGHRTARVRQPVPAAAGNITPAAPGQGALGPASAPKIPTPPTGGWPCCDDCAMYQAGDLKGFTAGSATRRTSSTSRCPGRPRHRAATLPALERNTADPSRCHLPPG